MKVREAAHAGSNGTNRLIIKELKSNDVLFGRGTGTNEYIGNRKFRAMVEDLKDTYASLDDLEQKREVAARVYDQIRSEGGRFLKLADTAKDVECIIEDGEWYETDQKVAMEKIKRALRERRESPTVPTPVPGSPYENVIWRPTPAFAGSSSGSVPVSASSSHEFTHEAMMVPSTDFSNVLPPALVTSGAGRPLFDARLRLFERTLFSSDAACSVTISSSMHTQNGLLSDNPHRHWTSHRDFSHGAIKAQGCNNRTNLASSDSSKPDQDTSHSHPSAEDDLSDFLMSSLSVANRPVLTRQQLDAEQANLTDEEKAEALSDLFGKYYRVNDDRRRKRARRVFDDDTVAFLVKQLRLEIDRIPAHKKTALLEAITKCRQDEFSDARLEQFLRCEGMNVKLAAQRFVNYWESRREVFGRDKYTMRMTLSEALGDDLVDLQAGYYCLLPHVDSSGRALLFCDPVRHTREGYTSESLVRAIWYVIEVASKRTDDIGGGVVRIMWARNTTVFDYDRSVVDRIVKFDDCVWPVRFSAVHICCPCSLVTRLIVPVVVALKDRSSRCRTLLHDVSESEILNVLSDFGIHPHMLPREMGGSVNFDASDWIARRRAAELEEI